MVSLNKIYAVVTKDDPFSVLLYWLAAPTLLFVQALGCGKEPFDPKPHLIYYSKPELPTDLLPYEEYLQVMACVMEVRDAQFC